jgi:hypothetical protein
MDLEELVRKLTELLDKGHDCVEILSEDGVRQIVYEVTESPKEDKDRRVVIEGCLYPALNDYIEPPKELMEEFERVEKARKEVREKFDHWMLTNHPESL